MTHLIVRLPRDRNRCGTLTLCDARGRKLSGPFSVGGRASDSLATKNANPTRNPLLRFGDTPTGEYRVQRILKTGRGTPFDAAQFGPHGIVVLEGILGAAALAEANGRFHVLIVGGNLSQDGALRSTAGALRLSDDNQRELVTALRKVRDVRCEIDNDFAGKSRALVFVDPDCTFQDPQDLHLGREGTAQRSLNRELLLSGAAGAMMSVAFVTLPPVPARASDPPTLQTHNVRDQVTFLPPSVGPHSGYVRLAYGGAMQQLENAQHQTTGKTFDNSNNPQPSDATPSGTVDVPAVTASPATTAPAPSPPASTPPPSTGNSQVDQVIQQQRQINAIQSEKPPPNATQEQLNQWQQDQQQRIQNVTNPTAQTPPPPAKANKVILDKGAPPPPPDKSGGSSQ